MWHIWQLSCGHSAQVQETKHFKICCSLGHLAFSFGQSNYELTHYYYNYNWRPFYRYFDFCCCWNKGKLIRFPLITRGGCEHSMLPCFKGEFANCAFKMCTSGFYTQQSDIRYHVQGMSKDLIQRIIILLFDLIFYFTIVYFCNITGYVPINILWGAYYKTDCFLSFKKDIL